VRVVLLPTVNVDKLILCDDVPMYWALTPLDPDEPVEPDDPDEPEDPDVPVDPDDPVDPEDPEDPEDPSCPVLPTILKETQGLENVLLAEPPI